jgi:hypothetical protein
MSVLPQINDLLLGSEVGLYAQLMHLTLLPIFPFSPKNLLTAEPYLKVGLFNA